MQNISKPSKFDDLEDVLGFLRLFEIRKVHQSLWVRGRCEKEDSARHREPQHDLLFEDRCTARNNLMHFHNRRKIKQNVLRTSAFGQRLLKSISRFSRPPKHVEKCAFQDIAKPTWISFEPQTVRRTPNINIQSVTLQLEFQFTNFKWKLKESLTKCTALSKKFFI